MVRSQMQIYLKTAELANTGWREKRRSRHLWNQFSIHEDAYQKMSICILFSYRRRLNETCPVNAIHAM